MRKKGIEVVKKNGVSVIDNEGELTTNLVNNQECSFVIFEDGFAKCAIEKAYHDGKTSFQKPISCHLFPIRVTKYHNFEALNYEDIKICKSSFSTCNMTGMNKLRGF